MKYFKTQKSRISERYEINLNKFIEITGRKYPFEQSNSSGGLSQYAVCPSCNNPIQLIGLLQKTKVKPYGKHSGKNIKGLPNHIQEKYEYCPFADPRHRKMPDDESRLLELDDFIIELYQLLKTEFDRVVYIIKKALDIRFSNAFLERSLNQFVVSQGHFYPWLTETNLPFVFAYIGIAHQNLLGQCFLVDSDIYYALSAHPNVRFMKEASEEKQDSYKYERLTNNNQFLNLQFRFTNHVQNASDGATLYESMLFCVDDRNTGRTIFTKEMVFDETHFWNIINKKDSNHYRNKKLLEIAETLMPPLVDM